MSLYDFIRAPGHYIARERLLHMKVAYEMKLHAAISQQQLQMTEPEIDNQGYDFIAAIGYDTVYLQNKSTLNDATVSSWDVHPALLQPSFGDRDLAPVVDRLRVGGLDGATGGVLLHVIDADAARNDSLRVMYYYFDVFYAAAVGSGLWEAGDFTRDDGRELLRRIQAGNHGERISLPRRSFLPVTSSAAVLAFRFHIPKPTNYIILSREANRFADDGKALPETFVQQFREGVGPWVAIGAT